MKSAPAEVWKQQSVARHYLGGVRGAIPLAAEQMDVLLRLLAAAPRPIRRFLDLGCGNGTLGAAVLRRFPEARGVFVDFSETMLDAARRRLKGRGGSAILVLADYVECGWGARLPGSPSFDAVISGYSIHHQPDAKKRRLYREIYGLLRPGGIFLNLEHVASVSRFGERLFDGRFIDALWRYERRRSPRASRRVIARRYHRRPDKAANRLAAVESQCRWLRSIGFVDVDCYFKLFELALFGGLKPRVE